MTLAQLHTRFKILFDKIDSFNTPEFNPEDIDVLLNVAQEKLINAVGKAGYERNQELLDYIKNIIVPYSTTSFTTTPLNKPGGVFVDLPVDYRRALLEEVDITYLDCNDLSKTSRIKVIPKTRDVYAVLKDDPFNKPDTSEIIRLGAAKIGNIQTFELIASTDATIVKYYLDYVRIPATIQYGTQYATPTTDVDCELSDTAMERIVEIAVEEAFRALHLNSQQTEQ